MENGGVKGGIQRPIRQSPLRLQSGKPGKDKPRDSEDQQAAAAHGRHDGHPHASRHCSPLLVRLPQRHYEDHFRHLAKYGRKTVDVRTAISKTKENSKTRKKKVGQLPTLPTRQGSTTWNGDLLDCRVRNEIGYGQAPLVVPRRACHQHF